MDISERDQLAQVADALHKFAAEIHTLGYSPSAVCGAEGVFLELSARMRRHADALVRAAAPPRSA